MIVLFADCFKRSLISIQIVFRHSVGCKRQEPLASVMRCFNPNILTKHDDASDIGGLNDLLSVPSLSAGSYPQENAVKHPVECLVQRAVAELLGLYTPVPIT